MQDGASFDPALYEEQAKQRRKKHRNDIKKGKGTQLRCWTINTGGLQGTWRMVNLIGDLPDDERPDILCIQETSCTDHQWIGLQRVMTQHGYRGFHTAGRQLGESQQGYQWHRGIATFVNDRLGANWLGGQSLSVGQFHAVAVDNLLVVNYYVIPRDEAITQQACKLQDFIEELRWRGRWVFMGDYNEVYPGSWIATLATIYGGWQPGHTFDSSRWSGRRVIDYMVANFDLPDMQAREEKLSDHKIITCEFEHHHRFDAEQWRFQPGVVFARPDWVSKERWQQIFNESYSQGQQEEWSESCKMVEQWQDWDDIIDNDGQTAIDYEWCLTCAQLSWAFNRAMKMAICEIPSSYDNEAEMRRVLHLVNHLHIKGFKSDIQQRKFPKQPRRVNMNQRKAQVRSGRLHELCRRLNKNNMDSETKNLVKKLYGDIEAEEIEIQDVVHDLRRHEARQFREEKDDSCQAISAWKHNMRHNMKAKTSWINKKGSKLSPSVETENGITSTKVEAAKALHDYWQSLWQQQQWCEEEKPSKIRRIVELLKNDIKQVKIAEGRPSFKHFRECMGGISGCAGADGWTAEEHSMVSASRAASRSVWEVMMRWELFQKIPTPLNNCKLVHLPKKELRILQPSQFRPIAILSAWWRAWSSTWVRSQWVQDWTAVLFPRHVTGGMPGALGPELMAATVAHELSSKRRGLTMDFKHAFDTVDVNVMESVFQKILPKSCSKWHTLLFLQWRSMQRWVVYDSGVHPEPLRVAQGLPQGDPSSCVVMATLMLALKKMVDESVQEEGQPVYQAIYMDDRTAIAKSHEKLLEVQQKWKEVADSYHLIENQTKAQFVNMDQKGSAFEVLGTVIGNFDEESQQGSRLIRRVQDIGLLYRKIGIMPTRVHEKINDVGTFGRAKLAYGWVSLKPLKDWIHQQEQALWKGIGKLTYANPHMRRTIGGANTSLRMVAFLRQLRLLSQRNAKLQDHGVEVTQCQLDQLVNSTLAELGWRQQDGKFVHDLYMDGFRLEDLIFEATWKKVGHHVRESFRKVHYDLYGRSGRHELSGHDFPPYDGKRRALACKWAKSDGLAWLLIQGAVQSPNVRSMSSHIQSQCVCCGHPNPTWDHLWLCIAGEVPSDVLLFRHWWPRDEKDLVLCQVFLDGLRKFNEQ